MKELKAYYDKKYDGNSISVDEAVMKKINEINRPKLFKAKYVVIAAIVSLLLGCAFIVTHEMYGPDGNILWRLIEGNEIVNDTDVIYSSLNLEEGDLVTISYKSNNPGALTQTRQKPWILSDILEANRINDRLYNIELNERYLDFEFNYVEVNSLYDQKLQDSYDDKSNDIAYIKLYKGIIDDASSFTYVYTNEDDEMIITVMPWLGIDLHSSNKSKFDRKKISINGYEGVLETSDGQNRFVIVKDETYISVKYSGVSLVEEQLIVILEGVVK